MARWGSLDNFKKMLAKAEGRSAAAEGDDGRSRRSEEEERSRFARPDVDRDSRDGRSGGGTGRMR